MTSQVYGPRRSGPRRPQSSQPPATQAENSTSMRPVCPFLGTLDRQNATAPAVEYPSFENHCMAHDGPQQIVLTEQATFCLAASHRTCPRFLAAAHLAPGEPSHTATHTTANIRHYPPAGPVVGLDSVIDLEGDEEAGISAARGKARRQKWSWIGAAMIFVSTLLCGGVFAVYVGWQMANTSYLAVSPGRVDTLADQPPQPQIYLVVTATSEPAAVGQAASPPPNDPGSMIQGQPAGTIQTETGQTFDPAQLPAAVTPTPGGAAGVDVLTVPATRQMANNGSLGPESSGQGEPLPPAQPLDTEPGQNQMTDPNLGALALDIPTRRPTPVLDIPTSTPGPAELQIIPTPIPPPSTPMVLISIADEELERGECTTIAWTVENVRAVYFDGSGVDGKGEREVCMRDKDLNYILTVMHADGSPHYHEATITFLAPTPTPTPTFTFTPEPYLTPTWTPMPPTSTPTPDVQYGASLASQTGDRIQCAAESTCEANLLVTNTGSAIDSMVVQIVNAGGWPAQVCRLDGVCDGASLVISSMGPGNTALVKLSVQIPALDAPQQAAYSVRAASQGSGQTVFSSSVQLTLEAGQ